VSRDFVQKSSSEALDCREILDVTVCSLFVLCILLIHK
jgi:hypothetical protein